MYTTKAQICIRRDTAANFTSANPTLALGEIAYETDTRNLKVGDGAAAWTALPYINPYRAGTAAADTSNTVMGSGAGAALQAGGTNNTFVGQNAGALVTTADDLTAVGSGALDANTSGINNTAVGTNSLGANTTGSSNTALGLNAGVQLTTGTENTFVGSGCGISVAGNSNAALGTFALGSNHGNGNVAVGRAALNAHTGADATAVGRNAGLLNTASDTVAVGAFALDANTTGARNTAVGFNGLGSNQTNADCTAVGHSALALSIGDGNTAVGSGALDANTSGNNNTAIGINSLGAVNTGTFNTAIGMNSAIALSSGSFNVVAGASASGSQTGGSNVSLGVNSMTAATTASRNVSVGISSLINNTTGGNNVVVGAEAGRYRGSGTDTLTVINDSVLIGNVARAAGDSQTNQIVIAGTNGLGNGSNTTTIGNSSTTGTFIPAGTLNVNNNINANSTSSLQCFRREALVDGGDVTGLVVRNAGATAADSITSIRQNVFNGASGSAWFQLGVNGFTAATPWAISGYDTFITTAQSNASLRLGSGSSNPRLTLLSNGNVRVDGGNLVLTGSGSVFMPSGQGIDFSATANSSGTMTSELLNDYEEGTWTPVLSDGTNNATMNNALGSYTKIGRMVTVWGYVVTSSLGSVSGDIRITGLPFVAATTNLSYGAGCTVTLGSSLDIPQYSSVSIRAHPTQTYCVLNVWDATTGTTVMQATEWTADGTIAFSFSYYV